MADGALSWLAMVAATYFADGSVPHRGDLPLAGALVCYRPYECADGWVTLGALEPKFWQALVPRRRARGPDRRRSSSARARTRTRRCRRSSRAARASSGRRSRASTTAAWSRCSSSTRRSTRELVARARDGRRARPARRRARRCASSACPVKLDRTPGEHARLPGPGARRAHRGGAARGRLLRAGGRRAARQAAPRRAPAECPAASTTSFAGVSAVAAMRTAPTARDERRGARRAARC